MVLHFFIPLLIAISALAQSHSPYDKCGSISPLRPFTIDQFLAEIETQNITHLEDALCLIPPAAWSNFTLVNRSQSLQSGSFENPRVVLFGDDIQSRPPKHITYALSFNGQADQRQYNNFEIMKFDQAKPANEQIEFLDLNFDQIKKQRTLERNPEICLSCHSFNAPLISALDIHKNGYEFGLPRPLWDAQSVHPTAYGINEHQTTTQIEAAQNFITHKESHPRYKFLPAIAINSDCFSATGCTITMFQKNLSDEQGNLENNNNRFSVLLAEVNRNRIVEFILNSENYKKYKYAISAAFLKCENIERYLPEPIRKGHFLYTNIDERLFPLTQESFEVIKEAQLKLTHFHCTAATCGDMEPFHDFSAIRRDPTLPYILDTVADRSIWPLMDPLRTANLRWLFEGRGISMAAWNMDLNFALGFYRFINAPTDVDPTSDLSFVFKNLVARDGDLQKIFANFLNNSSNEDYLNMFDAAKEKCTRLKTLSLKNFGN